MRDDDLAQWLSDRAALLCEAETGQDASFTAALFEGVLDTAFGGETQLLDSVLGGAADHAVAVGRDLSGLLAVPDRLRRHIFTRIEAEVDPEPALRLILAADLILHHATTRLIADYLNALTKTQEGIAAHLAARQTEAERKLMERTVELARANRELMRLEKAKADFISIAAHELKTPLTSVQGYARMLKEGAYAADQQATLLAGLQQGADRLLQIVEDMLIISAIETDTLNLCPERLSLARLIELVVKQRVHSAAGRRHEIRLEGLAELPEIKADQIRLHQALSNLLGNAIKFTPDGGQITISGQLLEPEDGSAPQIKLTIRDSGIGIAPEDREQIFEKFYRTGDVNRHSTSKSKFKGAGPGLGLPIARGLIEAHGGRLWAESPGHDETNLPGSAFHLVLPVDPALVTEADPPPTADLLIDQDNQI